MPKRKVGDALLPIISEGGICRRTECTRTGLMDIDATGGLNPTYDDHLDIRSSVPLAVPEMHSSVALVSVTLYLKPLTHRVFQYSGTIRRGVCGSPCDTPIF